MKVFRCAGLLTLLFGLFALVGLAQTSTITATMTTYAGPPLPVSGTPATSQGIDAPSSAIPDGAGGLYIASSTQNRIYRVSAGGTLSLIAGVGRSGFSGDGGLATSAQLAFPMGLALDAAGNLFVVDSSNNRIRRVTPAGIISTIAGTGTSGFSGDGGPAISARLNEPAGVAVDAAGNLFIADTDNNRIRKVTPAGIISTVAGTEAYGFAGDGGPATSAQLASPGGLAVDTTGSLFIADTLNYRIRKVTPAGIISTVAGRGEPGFSGDGGPATSAQFWFPSAVALDAAGNLFIADDRIRKVTPAGIISTVAGNGISGFSGDGGPATSAQLDEPVGVAVDAVGNLFVADSSGNRVRKVSPTGIISTVAGNGTSGFSGDGGPATSAQLQEPQAVAVDAAGNIFIADTNNHRIRKVTPAGIISTVAGNGTSGFGGDAGPATLAQLNEPRGVVVDEVGNLFIADLENHRIRKVTPAGIISTVVGDGTFGGSGDGGPATSAQLAHPYGVALDRAGNLLIADSARIRQVTPAGIISTVASSESIFGNSGFEWTDVAVDAAGNLFIADPFGNRITKFTSTGTLSAFWGTGNQGFSGDGGFAAGAELAFPLGVAMDAAGNLFIADSGNGRIRKVTPAGIISTVVGPETSGSSRITPNDVAVDAAGNLFIADIVGRIHKVTFEQRAAFSIVDRGGRSLLSLGTSPATTIGYASIQPTTGSTTPSGLAIFGFRQNNVLVTEAGVPASRALKSGRIYAEVNGPVNTGLAIANPNGQPATVSFFFTDSNGNNFGNGSTTIPANGQIAAFLNQSPFNGRSTLSGTFTFSSSVPIAVIALRGLTNERGEFLLTTLPVADLNAAPAPAPLVFPHFAAGGGWTTQIVLVNTTDGTLSGMFQFVDPSGRAATIPASGAYSIPARSSQKFQTPDGGPDILSGSVRVVPAANTATPSGLAIFSFRGAGITVAEAGVPASAAGTAFRLYAEASGSIQTGIAVTNLSTSAANVTLELSKLDGSSTGLTGTLTVAANGQTAIFLNQVQGFGSLQTPFQGILRLSSAASISVVGLRGRYNERGDFLITTTPAVDEAAAPSSTPLFFPHIADSGGYTTQFILFSGRPGQVSSGTMQLFSQFGGAMNLNLQ
jgi:sugar lactone lactonase YvrE